MRSKNHYFVNIMMLINIVTVDDVSEYMGEYFPIKYLHPEDSIPNKSDLNYYLRSLERTLNYFANNNPNDTGATEAVLKRVIKDYRNKLQEDEYNVIANAVKNADHMISHYIYDNQNFGWADIDFRISKILKDDTPQVYSISTFNRNLLTKWIYSGNKINAFIQDMDEAILPKEKYIELVDSWSAYYIKIKQSDKCLSRVAYNPEPIVLGKLRPCRPDPYCRRHIHADPSIAYTLSHRLLNMIVYRHTRRCYLRSAEEDARHIDVLCSSMYREAVYIARRGYFARDLFLEHVALCSLMGYQEFHRRQWFQKVSSWVDARGCVQEYRNYELNHTRIVLQLPRDAKPANIMRILRKKTMENACQHHPMALALIVLAHAVRHSVHFMQ